MRTRHLLSKQHRYPGNISFCANHESLSLSTLVQKAELLARRVLITTEIGGCFFSKNAQVAGDKQGEETSEGSTDHTWR